MTAALCGRLLLPEPNDHLVWSLGFGSASTTAPLGRHVVPPYDGRSTRPSLLLEPNGHLVWPLGSPSSLTAALCGCQLLEPNDHNNVVVGLTFNVDDCPVRSSRRPSTSTAT
ncbi:hypothetical protein FISHEDRAFT_73088 [Fistulina hepatica ATCC 64428]|uniref:Uncharacterized protein n=1 Tax=Fistulina hepatica ATCC 64428 TaxID=1128425 RepID=A0A0D7AGH2_9AGAR|nr:hypothetical protein FISHEDRAFT_73088 [Fistulina hepatica ATCC 64428]